MDWTALRARYDALVSALAEAYLLKKASLALFSDYPTKLPADMRKAIGRIVNSLSDDNPDPGLSAKERRKRRSFAAVEELGDAYFEHFDLAMASVMAAGAKNWSGDAYPLDKTIRAQACTIIFAQWAAYSTDCMRMMCKRQPNILKCNKQIKWDDLVTLGDWDATIGHLTETLVFELGLGDVTSTVTTFRQRFGLQVDYPEHLIEELRYAEKVRDVIVHNNGVASPRFISETKVSAVKLGDPVPVDDDFVTALFWRVMELSTILLVEIAEKHFKTARADLGTLWCNPWKPAKSKFTSSTGEPKK